MIRGIGILALTGSVIIGLGLIGAVVFFPDGDPAEALSFIKTMLIGAFAVLYLQKK